MMRHVSLNNRHYAQKMYVDDVCVCVYVYVYVCAGCERCAQLGPPPPTPPARTQAPSVTRSTPARQASPAAVPATTVRGTPSGGGGTWTSTRARDGTPQQQQWNSNLLHQRTPITAHPDDDDDDADAAEADARARHRRDSYADDLLPDDAGFSLPSNDTGDDAHSGSSSFRCGWVRVSCAIR
jgi:hypothetical protein